MNNNNKILASLNYFSIFFLPFLLPIIVYFVTDDEFVKHHAKRSFVSHLVPIVLLIAGFLITSFSLVSVDHYVDFFWNGNNRFIVLLPFIFVLLYGLLFFAVVIWNVFQGLKLLK